MLNKNTVRKIVGFAAGIFLAGMLSGCDTGAASVDTTTMTIEKDQSISLVIVETFDQEYYDQTGLQDMILSEIADYNRQQGEDLISVEKIEVTDGEARVMMHFASPQVYASFNHVKFFCGTVAEAQKSGYPLQVTLQDVSDYEKQLSSDQLKSMTEEKILLTEEQLSIRLPGKAEYVSDGVSTDDKRKQVTTSQNTNEMAYIIYQ